MNERIRALWVEADKLARPSGQSSVMMEKFAELIIRECAAICDPIPGLPFDVEVESVRYGCSKDIKKHFGIQE